MKLKQGVSLLGLTPQSCVGILVAYSIFREEGYDAVVTSGSEGSHKAKSKHYIGNAFDLRIGMVDADKRPPLVAKLAAALPGFDVILEADHIHVEWDPVGKTP